MSVWGDRMSSWKESFQRITQELELARRKKQALDELLAKNRMSQPTYEHLEKTLRESILDLEAHQRSLADTMTERTDELTKQLSLLELLLANLEIRHVGMEINYETYAESREILESGVDATRAELNEIKEALKNILHE